MPFSRVLCALWTLHPSNRVALVLRTATTDGTDRARNIHSPLRRRRLIARQTAPLRLVLVLAEEELPISRSAVRWWRVDGVSLLIVVGVLQLARSRSAMRPDLAGGDAVLGVAEDVGGEDVDDGHDGAEDAGCEGELPERHGDLAGSGLAVGEFAEDGNAEEEEGEA